MEDLEKIERSAKTVDEAIEIALLELGVSRAEVEVDVLSKGRTGILGIGAELSRVRLTKISHDTGNAGLTLNILNQLLRSMSVEARSTIVSSGSGPDDPAIINIEGMDAGLLIGRRGETLYALQYMVNLLVTATTGERTSVIVDIEGYQERRRQNMAALAKRSAAKVVSTRKPFTLEPMSAADRRIVHMTLTDDNRVNTESYGYGRDRRVTITPS
jgi:spoIIIJ-associated protein